MKAHTSAPAGHPRPASLVTVAILALLNQAGCEDSSYAVSLRCDVLLTEASPPTAAPGAAVTITGSPMTYVWDTAVYVGGARAEVTEVEREGCDDCDTCREDEECTSCSDCDACDAACAEECVETTTFVVPALEPGETWIRLYNVHGQSAALPFVVEGAAETGADTSETGTSETGSDTSETSSGSDTETAE